MLKEKIQDKVDLGENENGPLPTGIHRGHEVGDI